MSAGSVGFVVRASCSCPGFRGWKELEHVLWVARIAVHYFPGVNWAGSAACMVICVERNTMLAVGVRALTGVMVFCTVAAFVDQGDTFVHIVIPSLTFQTPCQLLLGLFHPDLLVADGEAVGQGSVGREWVSE